MKPRPVLAAAFVYAGAVLLALGVKALDIGYFGYDIETIGAFCNDGTVSSSTGQGTCSHHDGVERDRDAVTLMGFDFGERTDQTKTPLRLGGAAIAIVGAMSLGVGVTRSRSMSGPQLGAAQGPPPPGRGFLDLHVKVDHTTPGQRTTAIIHCDGSQTVARFEFDGLTDRGSQHLVELVRARHKKRFTPTESRAVEILGDDLFAALLPPPLEAVYRQQFDRARKHDVVLRLLLELDDITADLPWEYLHDAERASFLALSTETSLSRLLPVPDETRPQAPLGVVRILVMGSRPSGVDEIDIELEERRIHDALAQPVRDGSAVLEFVEGGTLERLRSHVQSFHPHIFHFVGHGHWDNEVDDGQLLFETARGHQHRVTGRELGVLLVRSGLRLVVLNSCNAARSSQRDRFSGIATSLVAQGVPAVLAMQYPIEDQSAATFGSHFLQRLIKTGSIDAALTEARQAVFTTQRHLEWGTPVLTTRVQVQQVLPLSRHTPEPPQLGIAKDHPE